MSVKRMSVKRMSVARYAVGERDIMEQDCQGGYYIRHVEAMTAEGLHSKSDIAAELAHRDIRIAALEAELAAEKHVGARIEDKLKASMARVAALEAKCETLEALVYALSHTDAEVLRATPVAETAAKLTPCDCIGSYCAELVIGNRIMRGTTYCKKARAGCSESDRKEDRPTPPYPWCRQPSVCRGTCPMDPSCGE